MPVAEAEAQLEQIRRIFLPMLRRVAEEYERKTPDGYPVVYDTAATGDIGIELDPAFALHIVRDGEELFAELYVRSSRTDSRSSASREKFSGAPTFDRRPLPYDVSDQHLRNLLAELMSRFNVQPGLIYITDS